MLEGLMVCLIVAFFCIVPIAVIVLIVKLLTSKKDDTKGLVNFERVVRSFYVYIILVFAFVMIVVGAISAFSSGLDILLPEVNNVESVRYVNELNESKVEFTEALAVLVTGVPLFVYHSKAAKSIEKSKKAKA